MMKSSPRAAQAELAFFENASRRPLLGEGGATLTETALSVALVVTMLIAAVKFAEVGVLFRATRASALYGSPSLAPPCERPDPPAGWNCP